MSFRQRQQCVEQIRLRLERRGVLLLCIGPPLLRFEALGLQLMHTRGIRRHPHEAMEFVGGQPARHQTEVVEDIHIGRMRPRRAVGHQIRAIKLVTFQVDTDEQHLGPCVRGMSLKIVPAEQEGAVGISRGQGTRGLGQVRIGDCARRLCTSRRRDHQQHGDRRGPEREATDGDHPGVPGARFVRAGVERPDCAAKTMAMFARLSTRRRQCQCGFPAHVPARLAICVALAVPSLLSGTDAPIAFADVTAEVGVGFVHAGSPTGEKYLIETMGAGVATLDYDNDGRLDLFFVNGAALSDPMSDSGPPPDKRDGRFHNRLYRQTPDRHFEDTTSRAGVAGTRYGMGVAVGDYDNDGDPDIYVTAYGGNTLYRNNGDGTFTDVTVEAGVGAGGWSASAAFVDVDHDGRLDLFVTRYLDWSFDINGFCGDRPPGHRAYCHPDRYRGVASLLYRNEGGARFTEIGASAGIADATGKALGVAMADFDRDGRIDIFVANDSVREFLFRNLGGGRFKDVALAAGAAYDQHGRAFAGMGVVFDDQDNDGWPDVLVTTLSNQLYANFRNERTGTFTYATHASGLAPFTRLRSGWGLALIDADNDGWRDLVVAQGHVLDTVELTTPHIAYRQPLLVARNLHTRFADVSGTAGAAFSVPRAARGLAVGDLDGDGRLTQSSTR